MPGVTNPRDAQDVLYQLCYGSFCAGVVVRGDTVIDAPTNLKSHIGKPIGRLLYWVAHQPRGGWVAVPRRAEHTVYERSDPDAEPADPPPVTHPAARAGRVRSGAL